MNEFSEFQRQQATFEMMRFTKPEWEERKRIRLNEARRKDGRKQIKKSKEKNLIRRDSKSKWKFEINSLMPLFSKISMPCYICFNIGINNNIYFLIVTLGQVECDNPKLIKAWEIFVLPCKSSIEIINNKTIIKRCKWYTICCSYYFDVPQNHIPFVIWWLFLSFPLSK